MYYAAQSDNLALTARIITRNSLLTRRCVRPVLGRDRLWFDSGKRPLNLAIWVVAHRKFDCSLGRSGRRPKHLKSLGGPTVTAYMLVLKSKTKTKTFEVIHSDFYFSLLCSFMQVSTNNLNFAVFVFYYIDSRGKQQLKRELAKMSYLAYSVYL